MFKILLIKGIDESLVYLDNDIRLIKESFEKISSQVEIAPSDKGALTNKIDELFDDSKGIDDIIIYYTGHAELSRNDLKFKINDCMGINKSYFSISEIYNASENSPCKSVTFILDCCNAGAAVDKLPNNKKYHLFLSCSKTERTHEIELFKASMFTHYICKIINEQPDESFDKEDNLTLCTLYNAVKKCIEDYNVDSYSKEPLPILWEQTDNSLLIKKRTVDITSIYDSVKQYLYQLNKCINTCSGECTEKYSWCSLIPRLDSNMGKYVTPTIKDYSNEKGSLLQKLDEFFYKWLKNKNNYLSILGDMGVGKSYACVYLSYLICNKYNESESFYVPILINLIDLSEELNNKNDLVSIIKKHTNNFFSKEGIDLLLQQKKFIFIMDGFDEISSDSNISIIINNFLKLQSIFKLKNKVLLTCRTHYFSEQEQIEDVLKGKISGTDFSSKLLDAEYPFSISELQEFSETEILEMIEKTYPQKQLEIWGKIQSLYDLSDLSKRPILLKLIISTLPQLEKYNGDINSSVLYKIYTRQLLYREIKYRKLTLDRSEKEEFISYIAWLMWKYDIFIIDSKRFNNEITDYFRDTMFSRDEINNVNYDLKVASFFIRTQENDYRFIHKSFFEYYLARKAIEELYNLENIDAWKEKWFSKEIATFIRGIITADNKRKQYYINCLIKLVLKTDDSIILWNSMHILSLLNEKDVKDNTDENIIKELRNRALSENDCVIIRQYCRLFGKFWDRQLAEELIDKIILIVRKNDEQNNNNNNTYFNYYGGAKSACQAFINHLDTENPKYDAKLHLYLLENLADLSFAKKLEKVAEKWNNFNKYKEAYNSAISKITSKKDE